MRPPEPDPIGQDQQNEDVIDNGDNLAEDYVEKVIHVKTKKVGYLIGTAGRTIRGFENNSGAKIDIMTPNSCDDETPVLLSGSADNVRNVLRMITDLYHMNNLSSQLWKHLRKTDDDHDALEVSGEDHEIFGHEEVCIPSQFMHVMLKIMPMLESADIGVHVDIGRERDEHPGVIPIGLVGLAHQNAKAVDKISEALSHFKNGQAEQPQNNNEANIEADKAPVICQAANNNNNSNFVTLLKRKRVGSESEVLSKSNDHRGKLDPFSTSAPRRSCKLAFRSSMTSLQSFHREKVELLRGKNQVNLQPICKLNNVMMEVVDSNDNKAEIVISGSEINVKRAKLQLLHSM